MALTLFSRRELLFGTSALASGLILSPADRLLGDEHRHFSVRQEIRNLKPRQLNRLRRALRTLQQMSAVNDYQDLAGYHGVPRQLCHTDRRLFLPWHRAYVFHFEQALQRIDRRVTLPYWDWTSEQSVNEGIPAAIAEPTCRLGGDEVPNPLYSATIRMEGDRPTVRFPGEPIELGSLARMVDYSYQMTDFLSFSNNLDVPHGGFHGWVKGSMGAVAYAAYDPIFWLHHANVDYQWARWQAGANNEDPSADLMSVPLPGFSMRVESVVHHQHNLGYTYEGLTPIPPVVKLWATTDGPTFRATVETASERRSRVFLVAHDLQVSAASFSIRVFLNQPDANSKTALKGNDHFAGTFGVFGHGQHRHLAHDKQSLPVVDLTDAIGRVVGKQDEKADVEITLVPLDMEGNPANIREVPLSHVSIQRI